MFSWALVEAGPKLNDEPVEEHIAIRPWSGWAADEDRVQIRVGLLRANFADRAMLDDPRSQVEVISPGSFIPILLVPAHDATFGLIAIDTDDTEVRRGRRWRLRPDRVGVIDPRFETLASGHQSGSFPE